MLDCWSKPVKDWSTAARRARPAPACSVGPTKKWSKLVKTAIFYKTPLFDQFSIKNGQTPMSGPPRGCSVVLLLLLLLLLLLSLMLLFLL